MSELRDVTETELQALRAYALMHGRSWKAALREDWLAGRVPGVLHALRNDPRFGPAGLLAFQFPDPDAAMDQQLTLPFRQEGA